MLFVMAPQQTEDVAFREVWQLYPCHKARKDAEKAWRQVKGWQHTAEILAAIAAQQQEHALADQQKQWHPQWPYLASWLRAERWRDEVALSARLTLDSEPCPRCGAVEGLCRDIKTCNARWLETQRRAPAEPV